MSVRRVSVHRGSILVRCNRSQKAQAAVTDRGWLLEQERKTEALRYRAPADRRFLIDPATLIDVTSHDVVISWSPRWSNSAARIQMWSCRALVNRVELAVLVVETHKAFRCRQKLGRNLARETRPVRIDILAQIDVEVS